jgi:hypothetical protein
LLRCGYGSCLCSFSRLHLDPAEAGFCGIERLVSGIHTHPALHSRATPPFALSGLSYSVGVRSVKVATGVWIERHVDGRLRGHDGGEEGDFSEIA